jgi:glutamate synthase domain-containing protein 3
MGDLGLTAGNVDFDHKGAAGHYYAAYSVAGMSFRIQGLVADSCFTAAYGGDLVIVPADRDRPLTLVGNTFGYGARGGRAYIAGRAGNRFGICLRKNAEGGGAQVVVEGVGANAFQYMTGGVALVLGSTGPNLGAGMTGGVVYLLDADAASLNTDYVKLEPVDVVDRLAIEELLSAHVAATESSTGQAIQERFDVRRFSKVTTRLRPEPLE